MKDLADKPARRRVRPLLLVLLWVWALLVFVVLDLFMEVSAFDGVRPNSRTYRGMRYVAHQMVGEEYVEDDEFSSRETHDTPLLPASHLPEELREALTRRDWITAWQVASKTGTNEIRLAGLGSQLGAAFRAHVRGRAKSKGSVAAWWAENEAIKRLTLAVRPQEEFARAMRHSAELLAAAGTDKYRAQESSNLLLRGLVAKDSVLSPEEAFETIRPVLEPMLESDSRDYPTQRAGYLLASLSTPAATALIVRTIENGTFHYDGVLEAIHDPDSASILSGALRRGPSFHLAGKLVAALVQSGDTGVDELRAVVRSGTEVEALAFAAALKGLAGALRTPDDLELVERSLQSASGLNTGVNYALGMSAFDEERADAYLRYVTTGRSTLSRGIALAFARWPRDSVTPYMEQLKTKAPSAYDEILLARRRVQEQARNAAARDRRRRLETRASARK